MKRVKKVRANTMLILAAGFLGVIFLGGFLLCLPCCNLESMNFLDALFTSTTSICVTGLVTITPATQFTLLGKIILLILIQVGGLGVVGVSTLFFYLMRRQLSSGKQGRMSVRRQVIMQESYGALHLSRVSQVAKWAIFGTLTAEGVFAFAYCFSFVPKYGLLPGIGISIFHSVSAFCNAGIDILGDTSLATYVDKPYMNCLTMLEIILAGIGFTVWYDVASNIRKSEKSKIRNKHWFHYLNLHSKLAISTTFFLLIGGTLAILILEMHNPSTLALMNGPQKLMAAAFQSVTTRTAGFYTISQRALHHSTKLVCCVLMIIGGSPGGTAGGIKTTTFAVLVMSCITVVKGGRDTECFGRRIKNESLRTAFAVLLLFFTAFLVGTILIITIEPDSVDAMAILYETASAIGTVGLSADLTPALLPGSHIVLIVLMYIGRLGPLTLALLFVGGSNPRDKIRRLPADNVMVG